MYFSASVCTVRRNRGGNPALILIKVYEIDLKPKVSTVLRFYDRQPKTVLLFINVPPAASLHCCLDHLWEIQTEDNYI